MKNIIEIEHLSKSFKDVKAVKDLSFRVKEGEFFAFLGINGAGKSTTISIMCGELPSDSGSVIVDGISIDNHKEHISRSVGVVFQNSLLDKDLTVYENLKYRTGLYGIFGSSFERRLKELSDIFMLDSYLNRQIKKLSGGQKRRVDIVRALLHNPKILILDEPTTGLDPQTRSVVWQNINDLRTKQGLTVFLTTHYMEEAQNLCSRVALMDHGKLEEVNTPAGLIDSLGNYTVDEFAGDETHSHYFHSREEAIAYLSGLSGQASLRETTLEDVFVERAGRHLMPS